MLNSDRFFTQLTVQKGIFHKGHLKLSQKNNYVDIYKQIENNLHIHLRGGGGGGVKNRARKKT